MMEICFKGRYFRFDTKRSQSDVEYQADCSGDIRRDVNGNYWLFIDGVGCGREVKKMMEYRIMAYFTEVYLPRSYKRKVVTSKQEAENLLQEAKEYYSSYRYLDRVVIQAREVTDWQEEA